jgi:PAS domain S-box-containing protein
LVDLQGRWLRVNPMLCEILGRTEQELLSVTFQDITHVADLQTDLDLMRDLLAGESSHYHMEKRYLLKDGSPIWCLLSVSLVRSGDGAPRYFVSQVQDISLRKAAELEIQQSLREKEVLLREIHHRVKNNLQIVSSILRLARANLTEPVHKELFDECQGRVRSMALIHEQLYRAEALGRIDFAEHLRQLCQLARQMWGSGSKVELALDLQVVWLELDTAVPLGLIANEVISNAFKHAFPAGRPGKVTIALDYEGAVLSLSIRDNGVGLARNFDAARSSSLGMRIVSNLVRQIRGEFELGGDGGVEFRLRMGSSEPALERGAA